MGKLAILTLIQLGGLGIVVFGAVFALLVGQALSLRETVAMSDLLSAETLSRIRKMIVFIFCATFAVEFLGAISMLRMWDDVPLWSGDLSDKWLFSIFHSVSAFCNAGLSLFSENLVRYKGNVGIYSVICSLIVLGGLGFTVLYNIADIASFRIKRFYKGLFRRPVLFASRPPKKMRLQTKIVLAVTCILIIGGAAVIYLFEQVCPQNSESKTTILDCLFQSITARTAGFNTIDIGAMSQPGQFILMLLMFIGGSPGSTAGGIKTVTFAIVIMAVAASLRQRSEVEMFKRSIRPDVAARAVALTIVYLSILITGILLLSITERNSSFSLMQIAFEATSAIGTVGLSTGITSSLTSAGKLIIIILMLAGRLSMLTLITSLTFGAKPVRYNYPAEGVMVG